MSRCYKCGANTSNIGCHAYSGRSSYPSGSDRGGSRSYSFGSGSSSNAGGSGFHDAGLSQQSVVIQQPNAVIAVLGTEINLGVVPGWYNPSDAEIARGINPHFKSLSSDSPQCIAAKEMFNKAIDEALGGSEAVGAVGFIAEVARVKADLERAKSEIRQNCRSKFNGYFRITPADFDKYLT